MRDASLTTSAPPDAALAPAPKQAGGNHFAEDRLDGLLNRLDRDLRDRELALLRELDARLAEPLGHTLRAAAEAHQALMEAAGLDGALEALPEEQTASWWERVNTYRTETRKQVLEPIQAKLEELDAGQVVDDRWRLMRDALDALVAEVPKEIVRAEPAALYGPGEDPALWRVRKVGVRLGRNLESAGRDTGNAVRRVFRKPLRPAPERIQRIPFGRLARYHVLVRLPQVQEGFFEAIHQQVALPVARLEAEVTEWTHGLLAEEGALAGPVRSVPEPLRLYLPEAGASETGGPGVVAVREAAVRAQALGALLDELIAAPPLSESLARSAEAVAGSVMQVLVQDVARADSFMLDLNDRQIPTELTRPVQRVARRAEKWKDWYRRAVNRLVLDIALIRLREDLLAQEAALIGEVSRDGFEPPLAWLTQAAERLQALREEGERVFAQTAPGAGAERLRVNLETLLKQASEAVERGVLEPLRKERPGRKAEEAAESGAGRLLERVEALPLRMMIQAPREPGAKALNPETTGREVGLREIAEQALDALLVERLRRAPEAVVQVLGAVQAETEQVVSVLRFNLEAALDELATETSGEPVAAARELALGGLARSTDLLLEQKRVLGEAVAPFVETAFKTYERGWDRLHERARVEDRIQEQFMDLRTQTLRRAKHLVRGAGEQARYGGRLALRALRLGRRRAEELVRLGQSAVGAAEFSDIDRRRTLEAVLEVEDMLARFPLVYRRLFSFQPVTDVALLEGREEDLSRVEELYGQWARGLANTLILVGHHGSGLTSFLNVLRETTLREADVFVLELEGRLRTEAAVAGKIAATLGLSLPEPATLDALQKAILAGPRSERPRVCMIEHLEHLFLRTVAGTDLVERVLAFMSMTDPRIFWMGTVVADGWPLVEKLEPALVGLTTKHAVAPLSRAALEALVMNRHRRSGLPVVFEEPADLNPLVRRKLKRMRSEEDRQLLLRQDFFDRLYRACDQSIMLALFYWLRAARLTADDTGLKVGPVEPLNFAFLNELSLAQAFTLKTFLEHATLTAEEHAEVFQISREESLQLFESLGNLVLIQSSQPRSREDDLPLATIQADGRYRLRPLLLSPILQYLRSKHIVY